MDSVTMNYIHTSPLVVKDNTDMLYNNINTSSTLNPCEHVTVLGATGAVCDGVVREVHREFSYFEEAKTDITIHVNNTKRCRMQLMSDIEKVIFSPPATIVFWSDGTKTIVKTSSHETFDEEKGLAMAISEKYLGNYSRFKKIVENAQRPER